MKVRIPRLLGVALLAATLGACATTDEDGVVESAAESTGDAIESAGEKASEVADDIENSATWQRIEGNWKQFTGSVKERWAELTDDEIGEIDGNKDQLVGKVQETYGIAREEAEEQVDEWAAAL